MANIYLISDGVPAGSLDIDKQYYDINMKSKADMLRLMIKKKCLSPTVKNIYSEIYIKVINSFAFNLIALKLLK